MARRPGTVRPPNSTPPAAKEGQVVAKIELDEEPTAPKGTAKEEFLESSEAAAMNAEMDARIQRATDRVVIAEIEATQTLESAHAMMEGEVKEDSLKVVEEMLQGQQTAMLEAHKVLAADIMDARRTASKAVPQLNNLTPRVRSVQASLAQEMKRTRTLYAKKKQEADEEKERAKAAEGMAKAEQRDAKSLEEALPEAIDIVTVAEDALDLVVTAASPLSIEFADANSEPIQVAIKDTEAAVGKAVEAIKTARAKLNKKVTEAKAFAPEAKKVALTEYLALQEKLNEAQKKLASYAGIRKDQEEKQEAKKVTDEVVSQLGAVEAQVEKVMNLVQAAQVSEEEVKSAESTLPTIASGLIKVMKLVGQKLTTAQGALKEDLTQMQQRCDTARKKLETARTQLRSLQEQVYVQSVLRQGLEKTQAAEEAFAETSAAEAPFLKGEDMTIFEAEEAVMACNNATMAAESKVYLVKAFLKAKLADVHRFPEDMRESTIDELSQLQSRAEIVGSKLSAFRRETTTREAAMLLQEVVRKVKDVEAKVSKTVDLSALLAVDKIEDMGVGKLKEATQQTLESDKEAAAACADAKKLILAKQNDAQAQESAGYAAELVSLQDRLTAAMQKLSDQRKVAIQGEKLWKSKLIVQDKEEQMKQLEKDIEEAELLTTPLGDEEQSPDKIIEMDAAVNGVQKTLDEIVESLEQARQGAQGSLKNQLAKLLGRTKKSQESIDEMRATTREQRERAQCEGIVSEARAKLDRVTAAFQQVAEAEVPYLNGDDTLPANEAIKAVANCEAAGSAVQRAMAEAKAFIASKTGIVKGLLEVVATSGLKEFEAFTTKLEESKEKLALFNAETDGRKRIALAQEASVRVQEAEEAVQRTVLAAAPLAADEETPQDVAQEIVEKLGDTEKEAQDRVDEAQKFLLDRQRDKKARLEPAELAALVKRLNTVQTDLAKAKATASEIEQRYVAKVLVQEATESYQGLESELEETIEAAAPLTAEGGKAFVVASMAKMILDALSESATKASQSKDQIFLQISSGASEGKVTESEFVTFLEKIPEICSRADLAFSSEQRLAIFEHMDSDNDGMISKADFLEMFQDRYICSEEVPLTDGLDPLQSKLVDTLLVDDVVEVLGEQKSLDTLGLIRAEVRVTKDGNTGWVTLQNNQGTAQFSPFTAYTQFIRNLDRTIATVQGNVAKVSSFMKTKSHELREVKQGPLANAKAELAQMRPKVNMMQTKLEQLYKQVEAGKRSHTKREEYEKRKQEEKKDRKAAALVLKAITERADKAQKALVHLEESAKPLLSVGETDSSSLEKPLTVRNAVTAASDGLSSLVGEAKECLAANDIRVTKAVRGPWLDARQDMAKLQKQVEGIEKKAKALTEKSQRAFDWLAETTVGLASAAMRKDIKAKGNSVEKLYVELAGKSEAQIAEPSFTKYLNKLQGIKFTPEQMQLLFQKGAAGGLSRRVFFGMVERYFRCVKEIAITSEFDIKNSTTVRKLEKDEFIEVLEGPQSDESLGVMRVRARVVSDGVTGWITAKGNQGTPFLQECPKPCYVACATVALQDGFTSKDCKEVRSLRPGEVVEVLEGPRQEVLGNAIRARGKAESDGKEGWFTVKNKQGEECAKQGQSTFSCISGIALTSDKNIKDCKVLRKLDKNETLVVLEGPIQDEGAGVTRIRARAPKDNLEGWVTTKGNAGSLYARETGRTYMVSTSMPLQNAFQSDAASDIRVLAEGETMVLIEGPKEEKSSSTARVNVRAITDGKTGWVTVKKETMKLWSPNYRCVSASTLTSDLKASKTVRDVDVDEILELIEGPTEDAQGVLRLKCCAEKDGSIGWMTIFTSEGTPILECQQAS